jgi:pSer/pThr/pTyr-binding forkhead associated (FHA) protein
MTDQLLEILKYALLALLYLFFARVLWAVWSEVRTARPAPTPAQSLAGEPHAVAAYDPTTAAERPAERSADRSAERPGAVAVAADPTARQRRPRRAKGGTVGRLTIIEPKTRKGSAYGVTQELSIGRAETCAIAMPDDTFVSQLHARVYSRDGAVWIEDLASTNGTYLNGQKLDHGAAALTRGDRIQIGSTILEAD